MRALRAPAVLLCLAPCSLQVGCATEEQVTFGEPERVTASVAAASVGSSSSGASCTPDAGCAVSFSKDVFGNALEITAKCSSALCHGAGTSGLKLTPGDAKAAYAALTTYMLAGQGAYVVPCDPSASKILCNMKVDPSTGPNPHGPCGSTMPKDNTMDMVDDAPLSLPQLNVIATWIQCGAPDN